MKDKEQLDQWLSELVGKLLDCFSSRLLLVVLVGSQAREDANEQSDIDLNVILDRVTLEDIAAYRTIIAEMPDCQMACGFLGGLAEIKLWPRYDLLSFFFSSRVLYGDLAEVIGTLSRKDIFDNAVITLSNINHAVRHTMIYGEITPEKAEKMKGLYKTAFFVVQGWHFLRYAEYVAQKQKMIENTENAEDRRILMIYLNWNENAENRKLHPDETMAVLERWSTGMFERLAEIEI